MYAFLKDDRGSSTMEFVLWLPLFMLILLMTADATFIYLSYTEMLNASRDAARRASIGLITSQTDLGVYIADTIPGAGYKYGFARSGDIVTVSVIKPYADIAMSPIFDALYDKNLTTTVSMRVEPGV